MRHCHHQQTQFKEIFLPQAVHTALGKNKGTLMMPSHVLHSPTRIREELKGLRTQVSCSTSRPISSHAPPATFAVDTQVLQKPLSNTWRLKSSQEDANENIASAGFVNIVGSRKPILFTLRWSLTLLCPTNIHNLFGTRWCFKNKNSIVIMVLLCI